MFYSIKTKQMKNNFIRLFFLFLFSYGKITYATTEYINKAIRLDGIDNNVRTGIENIKSPFTLELWMKGDDCQWKELEVLIGGGEYSAFEEIDYLPLVIKKGKLHNVSTGLESNDVLDDDWHHIALTCDGTFTTLFMDGYLVGRKDTVISIIPGTIGASEDNKTIFGGWIDEVRVWRIALSKRMIKKWMYKPITANHPHFNKLIAYYPFDDEIDKMALNWVGKGVMAWHIRNTRMEYYGHASLAYTEPSTNKKWKQPEKSTLLNIITVDSEWDVDQGTDNNQILKLRFAVTGTDKPLELEMIKLDLSQTTSLNDISKIHLYNAGRKACSPTRIELCGSGVIPDKQLEFNLPEKLLLYPGINYLLVTADITPQAKPKNIIKIIVPSVRIDGKEYRPEAATGTLPKLIISGSKNNPNVIKVLQWNIWHGGVHLGIDGRKDIIKLIRATNADIITMQEGYGAQQRIADSLGYYMNTASLKDNLVLFSRYPIEPKPSYRTFISNPVMVNLPQGRSIYVNACWLRYAFRPEYTWCFANPDQNPSVWIAEDTELPLTDITNLLEKDMYPVLGNRDIPMIVAGDFNSFSHLDWTKEAAPLHAGYGPVAFPVSKYMIDQGFKDSFREIHPDETERPEGTFAVIYGQLKNGRIDFIYYKGEQIKALYSKIIQTSPEIDDVWASDHSAVITIFKFVE